MIKANHLRAMFVVLLIAFFTACGSKLPAVKPYKMDIQQGNVVTSKMLLQLRPGMTKSQVRYILGTPLVVDSFHQNRWDYFYELRKQGEIISKRRVILDFENDALVTVRGDVVASEKTAETDENVLTQPKSVTPTKKETTSLLDKLKFWKKSDANKEAGLIINESLNADKMANKDAALTKADAVKKASESVAEKINDTNNVATGVVLASPNVLGQPDATLDDAQMQNQADEPVSVLRQPITLPQDEEALPPPVVAIDEKASTQIVEQVSKDEVAASEQPAQMQESKQDESSKMNDVDVVKQAVNAWAEAWRSKDVLKYIDAYAKDYKAPNMQSRNAWIAQRKNRMSPKQGDISVSLEDIVVVQNENKATVEFYQKYQSKVYQDDVMKQLVLEKNVKTNQWLIVKETVLANGKRPSVQQIKVPESADEHLDGVMEKIGF